MQLKVKVLQSQAENRLAWISLQLQVRFLTLAVRAYLKEVSSYQRIQ